MINSAPDKLQLSSCSTKTLSAGAKNSDRNGSILMVICLWKIKL